MKTFKLIVSLLTCLLIISSCKKNDDDDAIDNAITEVALDQFNMRALFPKDTWGNEVVNDFNNGLYPRECITAYLRESYSSADSAYLVQIYFMRFVNHFETEDAVKKEIEEIQSIYSSYTEYTLVSEIDNTTVSTFPAAMISCIRKENDTSFIENMFFIYQNKRLYQIEILMPESQVNTYYSNCMSIINTLKIND